MAPESLFFVVSLLQIIREAEERRPRAFILTVCHVSIRAIRPRLNLRVLLKPSRAGVGGSQRSPR